MHTAYLTRTWKSFIHNEPCVPSDARLVNFFKFNYGDVNLLKLHHYKRVNWSHDLNGVCYLVSVYFLCC